MRERATLIFINVLSDNDLLNVLRDKSDQRSDNFTNTQKKTTFLDE